MIVYASCKSKLASMKQCVLETLKYFETFKERPFETSSKHLMWMVHHLKPPGLQEITHLEMGTDSEALKPLDPLKPLQLEPGAWGGWGSLASWFAGGSLVGFGFSIDHTNEEWPSEFTWCSCTFWPYIACKHTSEDTRLRLSTPRFQTWTSGVD